MEKIRIQQNGPVGLDELPRHAVSDVQLSWQHASDEDEIARHLGDVMGQGRVVHYAMVRRAIAWNKTRWQARLSVGRSQARLRAQRLRASQLHDLTVAIQAIPGASYLRLVARPG